MVTGKTAGGNGMGVHLAARSGYSFHYGTAQPEQLVQAAAMRGITALALTDLNGVYGTADFCKAAREHGVKPIIGATVDEPQDRPQSAVVLARSAKGYETLCRLCSARHLTPGFKLAEMLPQHCEDVFVLTRDAALLRTLAPILPPSQLFIPVLPPAKPQTLLALQQAQVLADELKLKLVAVNDACMLDAEDFPVHQLLRAIGENETVWSVKGCAEPERTLLSAAEMAQAFAQLPEALEAARIIAGECNFELARGTWHFPRFPLPDGVTPARRLRELAVEGARRRYGGISRKVEKRLDYELRVICEHGFAPYLFVVHDIVSEANRRGIPNLGRGSAANSIVCYSLNLTHVEPLAYNLYFERFLNPDRKSPPDVDIDLNWKRRDEIIQYVYDRYGADRVAMISTHVTFQARSSLRESAKAMGLLDSEMERFLKRLPFWSGESIPDDPATAFPETRGIDLSAPEYVELFALAQRLSNLPQHLGIHAGGIVIAPEDIRKHTALYEASKGFVVTHHEMYGVEDAGLIKIDLLGNRSLGVLEDALASLAARGITPPVDDFGATTGDARTVAMIRGGKTMGCFYIESPAMRSLLAKLRTETFEELTAASSVIRPGVAESGMMQEYVRRHRNPEFVRHIHPELGRVLAETHGVMIYQEDVMKVAHEIAGMSLAQADLLRRAMSGKLRSNEAMLKLRTEFLEQAQARGVDPPVARELWRQIRSFAGYAFCKAHSAAFAVLSFQVAYLKSHHPAEFMAAVLANHGGYYATSVYIQECRRLGLRILPPCVNASELHFTAEDSGKAVRIGLGEISEVHAGSLESIVDARRRDGEFRSLRDFLRRTHARYADLIVLARVGALDCLGFTRPQVLWLLQCEFANSKGDGFLELDDGRGAELLEQLPPLADWDALRRCQMELEYLGYGAGAHPLAFFLPHMGELHRACDLPKMAGREVRLAGWCISTKRVDIRRREEVRKDDGDGGADARGDGRNAQADAMGSDDDERVRPSDDLGITPRADSSPTVRVATGKRMKFMSMEDLTGTYEAVLFPDAYERFAHIASKPGPFTVVGRVEDNAGGINVNVRELTIFGAIPDKAQVALIGLTEAEQNVGKDGRWG